MRAAANDPDKPEPDAGGSDTGVAVARTAIRLLVVGAAGLALWLFFALNAGADELTGKVIHVADGDTITVLDAGKRQFQVRLSGIDAPEKAQPFGARSKESLASVIAGRSVTVQWHKRDRFGRLVGVVVADSHDVGLVQIERGMAWHYKAYEREQLPEDARAYADAEDAAKAAHVGLWADRAPVPPWEWRRVRRQ
jgi:endonuclease YncB( thermonuclease family)